MQTLYEIPNTAAGQGANAEGFLPPATYSESEAAAQSASARRETLRVVGRRMVTIGRFCGIAAALVVLKGGCNVLLFHHAFYDGFDSALITSGSVLVSLILVKQLRSIS